MATKSTVPVEEYLRMSFDGPAPEYLDGELVARNVGELKLSIYDENGLRDVPRLQAPELVFEITPDRIFE